MNKKNIKFDHTNNNFHDAIGLSRNEVEKLLIQAKKIFDNIDKEKKSVAVEEILDVINNMDYRELSVVIFLLLDFIRHKVGNVLIGNMVKMIEMDTPTHSSPKLTNPNDDRFDQSYT